MKVTLIERYLPHYRLKFCEAARARLARDGIEFSLVYGQPNAMEGKKKDTVDIPWARKIHNHYLPMKLVYQPCWNEVKDSDLIIIEQANKLLLNFLLFALRPFKKYKLGFIGHGYCHQQDSGSLSNRFKKTYAKAVDWWFAYTDSVSEYLVGLGFPGDHLTVINNSIDTEEVRAHAQSIRPQEVEELKSQIAGGNGPIGVYCGGMYAEKEIAFLIAACLEIRAAVPGFRLVMMGAGPDEQIAREAARENPWIHYLGPKFGRAKVLYLMASDAFLLPGAVGLAILDCFAVGLPLLTSRHPGHGPEISYLREGLNGMMTDFDSAQYVAMVTHVLRDRSLLNRLREGSALCCSEFSMDKMVERFCEGVKKSLGRR